MVVQVLGRQPGTRLDIRVAGAGDHLGQRRHWTLLVSAIAYTCNHPVIVLIRSRADGDVPGILLPVPMN